MHFDARERRRHARASLEGHGAEDAIEIRGVGDHAFKRIERSCMTRQHAIDAFLGYQDTAQQSGSVQAQACRQLVGISDGNEAVERDVKLRQ